MDEQQRRAGKREVDEEPVPGQGHREIGGNGREGKITAWAEPTQRKIMMVMRVIIIKLRVANLMHP